MDLALLIDKYLSDKSELRHQDDSFNIVENSIHRWDFANVPAPTMEELEALEPVVQAEQNQAQINAQAKQFLNDTDKLVIRHRDQKELGIPTKLSEEEFQALLVERQAARNRVI